jgi:hypothetical protein
MFERFTKDARDVVQGAVGYAEEARAQTVDPEHLLLALLDREGSRASFALAALGVAGRGDAVRQALTEARRRAGLSQAETDALAGLGIDVSEIVARVEEAHGVGAMSGGRKDSRWWSDTAASAGVPRRCWRRPCGSPSPGATGASGTSTSSSP